MSKKKAKVEGKTKVEQREHCPKCHKEEFVIEEGIGQRRFCRAKFCKTIWNPRSVDEIAIDHSNKLMKTYKIRWETANAVIAEIEKALDGTMSHDLVATAVEVVEKRAMANLPVAASAPSEEIFQ